MTMMLLASAAHGSRPFRRSVQRPLLLRRRLVSSTNGGGKKDAQKVTIETENVTIIAETKPPLPLAVDPPLLNPFPLLAHATENVDLASRLRSYSNTFGIIGALMCTLSIQALGLKPIQDERLRAEDSEDAVPAVQRRRPVLVKYVGIPKEYLEDMYMASWAVSFLSSAVGLGLSTVVAGIVASTAPAYVKIFVRRHSDVLIALPIAQAISGAFAMAGLTIGLDEARGEPVAWIGYIGAAVGTYFVGVSSFRILKGYKASRASGKLSLPKEGPPLATKHVE